MAAVTFTTTANDILPGLAGILKTAVTSLQSYWTPIADSARLRAYNEIITQVGDRGFSLAQIQAWIRNAEFERDIALYFCLVEGAGTIGVDERIWVHLDRRQELLTAVLVATDGTGLQPHLANQQITTGAVNSDNCQFYRTVDSDRTANQTQW